MNRQWGLVIFCIVMLLATAAYALPNEKEELMVIGQESAQPCDTCESAGTLSDAEESPASPDTLEVGAYAQHIGVFRGGKWYLDADSSRSWNAANDVCTPFGLTTDTPIPRYWIGTFRNGNWYIDTNQNGVWDGAVTDQSFVFGLAGDKPVGGVLKGGTSVYFGVFRSGWWYIDWNSNHVWDGAATDAKWAFGLAGDLPVVADWSNSGTDRIGTFRNGKWYVDWNGNHQWDGSVTDRVFTFGQAGDIPVTGDWSNSGVERIGVFRNGKWYVDWNGNNAWDGSVTDRVWTFGQAGDKPHVRHYNPPPSGPSVEIVNRHNYWRGLLYTGNQLTWSPTLASSAQTWANTLQSTCAMGHSSSGYGENIYYTTSGTATWTNAIDAWASEKSCYQHVAPFGCSCVIQSGSCAASDPCGVTYDCQPGHLCWNSFIGHYTQVVWKTTTQVGCGYAPKGSCTYNYYVCQYNPAGNWLGNWAY